MYSGERREAYPRVRRHRTRRPRETLRRRGRAARPGALCRAQRKSPRSRKRWAHNLCGSRSRQTSPYTFRLRAQARSGPQSSGRSAEGSARTKRMNEKMRK